MNSFYKLWNLITRLMSTWHEGKVLVENSVTVSHDVLHVIFGILAWMLFAFLLRTPVTSRSPWLCVLALILWNEVVDLWTEHWPDGAQYSPNRATQYREGVKDVLLTMLVPTLIVAATRVGPKLFQRTLHARRRH